MGGLNTRHVLGKWPKHLHVLHCLGSPEYMGCEVMVPIGSLGFREGIKMLSVSLLMSCTSIVAIDSTRRLMYDSWASHAGPLQ